MPSDINNNHGGISGRAASVTASRCAAARAGNVPAIAPSLTVMTCAVTALVLNAPELWPQLFVP